VLWKPLLRSFRAFLRKLAKIECNPARNMFKPNGKLRILAKKRWSVLLKTINAPEYYREDVQSQQALGVLLAPVTKGNLERFFKDVPSLVLNIDLSKDIYCTIFRENSFKLRSQFFSDKFI